MTLFIALGAALVFAGGAFALPMLLVRFWRPTTNQSQCDGAKGIKAIPTSGCSRHDQANDLVPEVLNSASNEQTK